MFIYFLIYPDNMTKLPWLMFILTLISTFQWPNSIAQHDFILYNNSQRVENVWLPTKNDPEKTSLNNQNNTTTTKTLNCKEDQKNDPVNGIENIEVIVLPTANLKNSSTIVFPTSIEKKIKINKFVPEQNAIDKCSLNESYCITIDNYPREELSNLFRTSKFIENIYYDIDPMNEINHSETRMSDSLLEPFCQSRTEVIYPEAGLTSKNEWRYIVQNPEFNDNGTFIKQGILVEKCINTRLPCKFDSSLPPGYVSTCIQKYIYKRLITIEGSQHFHYDTFKMPSCCQCMYSIN